MYNFIYSTSNEYAPYCAASIKSMLMNNDQLAGSGGGISIFLPTT